MRTWQKSVPRLILVLALCLGISPVFGQNECYELVWNDEFSNAAVDATKWEFEVNGQGGGNNELQYYTDRPDNTQIVDGKLQIIAREEVFTGTDGTRNYTSSRLRTAGLAEWTYGRIEASIKIPEGQGMWPAFWMLPTDYAYGIWPQSGEIDIMENVGFEPDIVHGTIHYGPLWPNNKSTGSSTSVPNSASAFHTYAIEWEENEIRWYVDDVLYSTRVPSDLSPDFWPFDQDFHIILNVAVGGAWPGPPDNTTVFPQVMEVDYVRVYKGLNHYGIDGPEEVRQDDTDTYTIDPISGASYNWTVPAGATLVSGNGTNSISVNWGIQGTAELSCVVITSCESTTYTRDITISEALTISHVFDDFESNRNCSYDLGLTSGALTQAIANPNSSGANASAQVGQYVRNASEQYDVLFVNSSDIGNANDYVNGRKTIFMDLYTDAPAGTSITINLEDASLSNSNDFPTGRHSSYTASTSLVNAWQTLEFSYDSSPDATGTGIFSVDQLAILFDPNNLSANTYYFDNFQVGSESAPIVLSTDIIEDFDGTSNWNQVLVSGTFSAPITNPDADANNGSVNVASYVRNAAEQYDVIIYDGVTQITDAGLMVDGDSKLLMDVYTSAPVGTPLSFNLENSNLSSGDYPAGRHSIYQAVTTVQNAWETITFEYAFQPDASTADGSINQIVFLLNSNSFTGDTYYFDNVRVINTKPPTSYNEGDVYNDYETLELFTYASSDGTISGTIANPAPDATNGSVNVVSYSRNGGSLYDVLFFNTSAISSSGPFESEEKTFAVDIYTDAAPGTPITFQLEDGTVTTAGNFPSGRRSRWVGSTTLQNAWETIILSYDGVLDAGTAQTSINQIAVLFDANNLSNNTYYIDNIRDLNVVEGGDPFLALFDVSPTSDTLEIGETIQFAAQGKDQFGEDIAGVASWTVDGGGTINANGLFTATTSGLFTATASNGSATGTAEIRVNGAATLTAIAISPATIQIYTNETATFTAQGYDQFGEILATSVIWTSNGGSVATDGLFTPDAAGSFEVTATSGSISNTATVTVLDPPVLTSISVSPNLSNLDLGETQAYAAQGLDQYGDAIASSVLWTTSGGTITSDGIFSSTSEGTFTITASDGAISGTAQAFVQEAVNGPTVAAPSPTQDVADVVSLFSNAYTNETVETFSAVWDDSDVADEQVAGDDVKKYTFTNFAGIDFSNNKLNLSSKTRFHLDIWTPDDIADKSFTVKNVDFGGGTAEASSHILTVTQVANGNIPALASGSWLSIDVDIDDFVGNTTRSDLAQIVITTNLTTVYIDNLYFYGDDGSGGGGDTPTVAAPAPTSAEADVISIYSDAYTSISGVDTNPNWGQSTVVTNEVIGTDNVLKLATFNYQGTDFSGNPQDVSGMEYVHLDLWTADATTVNFYLISPGPAEVGYSLPITTGSWQSYDIPLSAFSAGVDLTNVFQFKFDGGDGSPTFYLDNLYFYQSGGSTGGGPVSAAPSPTQDAADVVSLFSNAYTNETVETFSAAWDDSDVADEQVADDDVKKYTFTNFAGIDFSNNKLNLSSKTRFHLDIWTPDDIADKSFTVKNVDFGGGSAEVSSHILTVTQVANGDIPALASGSWLSIDVDIDDFVGNTTRSDLAQIVITTNLTTVYIDNLYFYGDDGSGGGGDTPTVAAPAPTSAEADVISIYSDAYTNISGVDTNPNWGQSTVVTNEVIGTDNVLKYATFNYQGTDFSGNPQDVSGMEYVHLDLWTADATTVNFYLISPGPAEVAYSLPITTGSWQSYDIPLSAFSAGVDLTNVFQFKFDGGDGTPTFYIDNMYFYQSAVVPTAPTVAAPNPSEAEADVISVYSDAYTNISGVDTNPNWGQSTVVTEEEIVGNNTLKYATFNYQGTDFSGNPQDVSGMEYVHLDLWTADATTVNFYLISPGPAEVGYSLPITTGSWQSYDIPLSAFSAGVDLTNVFQFKFDGGDGSPTFYLDNLYFYQSGGSTGGGPVSAAPSPTQDAADVVSLFSNAYTNETVETFSAAWDDSDVADEQVADDDVKKYTFTNFAGIDFSNNKLNLSSKTRFHLDIWTPDDIADKSFTVKNVDFGGGSAEVSSHILTVTQVANGDIPALASGSWLSIDVDIDDFVGNTTRSDLAQIVITTNLTTVYIDNLYFYGDDGSGGGGDTPTVAAPAPTSAEADVISIYSDAYTSISGVDTNPNWGQSTVVTNEVVGTDNVLKLATFNYQGTDFSGNPQDVSGMEYVHLDLWTADATTVNFYLISPGPAEVAYSLPITTGSWQSYDIPLSAFSAGVDLTNVFQFKFDGGDGTPTFYIDNMYFYQSAVIPTAPTVAAPAPTEAETDVISMFSDAYTDVSVDTWRTGWSAADLEDVVIDGSAMKKYTDLNFVGIETVANQIDASSMSHFHFDLWTPDAEQFRVKLVDFGADGAFGGTDDTEHELTFDNPDQSEWISYDIPLTDFAGLTNTHNIAQLIYASAPAGSVTAFIDNVYFYNEVIVACESGLTGNSLGEDYVLVWADEFDASGSVCDENWFHQTQLPTPGGWFNGEEQHYTDRTDNSSVADGLLSITAKRETYVDQDLTRNFTSARLNSKFAFTYGRVDVRAKIPAGSGTWPAIWMLGQNVNEPGGFWFDEFGTTNWPGTGEIDIMEHFGNQNAVIHGSIHTPSSFGATVNTGTINVSDFNTVFHEYSIIWDEEQIQFLIDDVPYYTYNPSVKNSDTWPFDEPQYLLLNVAMGGFSGTIPAAFDEATMEIDYVRVYQKEFIAPTEPAIAANNPTQPEEQVISLFSDSYSDVPVDTWRTGWSAADLEDVTIAGSGMKKYTNLNFVGIETVTNQIDATNMTHFHFDLWTPDASQFRVKLVDFGADGAFGGDDTEHELTFDTPQQGQWISYNIPLTEFTGLTTQANIAQLIYAAAPAGAATAFIDNVYFYRELTAPETAAPAPTQDEANVISMFSETYTDVPVDTWRTVWSSGDLEDVTIDGSDMKKYTNLSFVGIETVNNQIDASEMDFFHFDLWTPDAEQFRVKWVDFGADGTFGGTDDTEFELSYDNPAPGQWVSFDIPMAAFVGMNTANLSQLIFSGNPAGAFTAFIDNVYFYTGNIVTPEPVVAAPNPTEDASNVISLFSEAYADITVDTWRTDWSVGDLEDVTIDGSAMKKYTNLNFVGIETVTNQIDATDMNHLHFDLWSPDVTLFRVKLVDFGADGAFGGGDDSEHEIAFDNLTQSHWISFDIPLSDFINLTSTNHVAQLIYSGQPAGLFTAFIDNVYFYNDNPAPAGPQVAADTPPERDASQVISLFSNAYSNEVIDTFSAVWDDSDVADLQVAGDDIKLYTFTNFAGIDFSSNKLDASAMDKFHMDIWTPDDVLDKAFTIKAVDFAGGSAEASNFILTVTHTANGNIPALASGAWVAIDVDVSDFAGNITRNDLAQMVITTNLTNVYVDNIYFYTEADLEPPTVPANVTSTNVTASSFDLSWDISKDNVGVTGYNVYLDGVLTGTVTEASISIDGLMPATAYEVLVEAVDAAGNSAASDVLTVTTIDIPCVDTIVDHADFEWDNGVWRWGWRGARLARNRWVANSGRYSVKVLKRIRTESIDLSNFENVNISFNFLTFRVDRRHEGLTLEMSTDGGENYQEVEQWNYKTDFRNWNREFVSVDIDGPFSSATIFRLKVDVSRWESIYVDDIVISGCSTGNGASSLARTYVEPRSDDNFDLTELAQVTVYPNPVQDVLRLQGVLSDAKLTLYNLNGTRLLEANGVEKLDMTDISEGIYLLKVRNGDEDEIVLRINKQ